MKEKAYISGSVLRWSRETAKFSLDEVAKRMLCDTSKVEEWENEKDFPTLKQAEKLSQLFRRPLAVFFLPSPPEDFQTLRDFRNKSAQKDYSTALTFVIRDIQQKQNWLKEFLLSEGENPLAFIDKYSKSNKVDEIAKDIITQLDIDRSIKTNDYLKYFIDKVETKRIYVSLTSNIHSHLPILIDEVRGFAISDSMAPFIFINSSDSKNGQLFTLVHELAHLWLNTSGISNIDTIEFRENSANYDPIEILCNEIAAEILMPTIHIKEYFNNKKIELNYIDSIAKILNVSSYALSVRLLNLNYIEKKYFFQLKEIFEKRYLEYLEREAQKTKKIVVNWYILQIRKNSRAFTHNIYDFYKGGRITGYEASSLLNVKISNFQKLEKFLFA